MTSLRKKAYSMKISLQNFIKKKIIASFTFKNKPFDV